MAITVVFGPPGSGKSCLLVYFAKQIFATRHRILRETKESIENKKAEGIGEDLSLPTKAPIFSDFPMTFPAGYNETYTTYFVNGFYLGMPDGENEVMSVPPNSYIFLSEVQRYFNSRKSATLPDRVARFYEMHRHYGLNIYMDIQRPELIDPCIREIASKFIEIVKLEHETDKIGRITRSTWTVREFDSWGEVDRFKKSETAKKKPTKYVFEGNIFKYYNSFSYYDSFLPKKDFKLYEHFNKSDDPIYRISEPKGYRSKADGGKDKK